MLHFFTIVRRLGPGFMLICIAAAARGDNWEQFRGSKGDGVSHDKNIPIKFNSQAGVLWKTQLGGAGNSCPVVWGNRLFVQTTSDSGSERALVCIDTADGKVFWKRSIPAGKAHIHKMNSLASSTPATDGEAVFVSFWDGKDIILAAYSIKGEPLWQRNFGEFVSEHGAGASPIVYKNLVIFANDMDRLDKKTKKLTPAPSRLFALDKKTGTNVWETPREAHRACYSLPFVLENKGAAPELIVTSTTAITSYDPLTGRTNWNWKWVFSAKAPLRTVATTAYANGLLLACSGDGGGDRHMVALAMNGFGKEARPDKLWENKRDFPYVPSPLTRGEHAYFVNDSGYAFCFHLKSGKKVWQERQPDAKFSASPVMIDGKIYACSEQGDVYVFAAEPTYQQLAKNSLGALIRATPAVADGRLYIRGGEYLFCIGNK
jgi:outer membrane protein assembly factor BamB